MKTTKATLSGTVDTATLYLFGLAVEKQFKGKKSQALNILLAKALKGIQVESMTQDELTSLRVAVNLELSDRERLAREAQEVEEKLNATNQRPAPTQ